MWLVYTNVYVYIHAICTHLYREQERDTVYVYIYIPALLSLLRIQFKSGTGHANSACVYIWASSCLELATPLMVGARGITCTLLQATWTLMTPPVLSLFWATS